MPSDRPPRLRCKAWVAPLRHVGQLSRSCNQVRGQFGHPSCCAGRAETATLAGEGNQLVATAAVTVHAAEAVGQDAALQVVGELADDEAGQDAAGFRIVCGGEEGLEVLLEHFVQNGGLRLVPRLGVCPHEEGVARKAFWFTGPSSAATMLRHNPCAVP